MELGGRYFIDAVTGMRCRVVGQSEGERDSWVCEPVDVQTLRIEIPLPGGVRCSWNERRQRFTADRAYVEAGIERWRQRADELRSRSQPLERLAAALGITYAGQER